MKVCIVAEGCYPYVVGGVSGWINSMIKSFPNVEFILLAIVANRSLRGKFVYELPENLTQVYEVYLDDCEWEGGGKKSGKKVHLSHKERDELLNMVLNRETDWGVIFDLFHKKNLSVDELLMGPDFFEIARECYNRNYPNINCPIFCGRFARFICRCSGRCGWMCQKRICITVWQPDMPEFWEVWQSIFMEARC